MPLVNPLIPGGDWRNLVVGPDVRVGNFAGTLLDFVIIAFAIFLTIRFTSKMRESK
jgi:large conductance mechanosensitive channel